MTVAVLSFAYVTNFVIYPEQMKIFAIGQRRFQSFVEVHVIHQNFKVLKFNHSISLAW